MGVGAEYFLRRPFSSKKPVPGCAGTHDFQTGMRCAFTKMHEELQFYLCHVSLTNTRCVFTILIKPKLDLKSSHPTVKYMPEPL